MWRAALLYLALAVVATWPLARQLDTSVAHDLGDPLLVTYLLNWNARVAPFSDAWWSPPFFWPAPHVLVLSEHLLGLSAVASPLIWLGVSPLATYNLLFIGSFWTAGMGGWVLGRALTGRDAPAWIAGLVLMFAPYRFSHLPHLQILFSPGVPLLFAALHAASAQLRGRESDAPTDPSPRSITVDGRFTRWQWPVLVAICWLWQGLVSGYFLAFLPIALVLWMMWFAPTRWALWGRLAVSGGIGAIAIAPLLWRYALLQQAGGYRRELQEVLEFSADVAGLWQVSDKLALWGRLLPKGAVEEQFFPGVATLALALAALATLPRPPGRVRLATQLGLGLAAILLSAAAVAAVAPGAFTFLGIHVSITHPHKPLGAAWIALGVAVITSRTFLASWRQHSPAGGYLLIAFACWVLALGPVPTVTGERIWYLAPYAWLYDYVPGFTAFRVPARLYLVTSVALAALAAIGIQRLTRPLVLAAVLSVASVAVVAEGWLARMPLVPAPQPITIPADAVAVLELPTGDAGRDATAMYRSLFHGRPVLNGWSGYRPRSAERLSNIDAGDVFALDTWTLHGPLAIVIDRDVAHVARYEAMMKDVGATCQPEGTALVCLMKPAGTER